jgi:hypothetical protein
LQQIADDLHYQKIFENGFEDEWGYFSQAEIESLKPKTWEIKKKDLPYAGRRGLSDFRRF